MTTSTLDSNGRLHRKTLSSQIDRLDSMLEGLAENLNDAVGLAVKETVAQVVRDAVELAVKEVLSSPELLTAALAQHIPPLPELLPSPPKPQRRSLLDMVKGGWNWLCKKATSTVGYAKKKVGQGLSWCMEKVSKGCASLWNHRKGWVATCVGAVTALGTASLTLWHFRRSVSIALTAGLIAGVSGYVAGPLLSALLSGLGGMAITLSTMILLPFWNLLHFGQSNNALD